MPSFACQCARLAYTSVYTVGYSCFSKWDRKRLETKSTDAATLEPTLSERQHAERKLHVSATILIMNCVTLLQVSSHLFA